MADDRAYRVLIQYMPEDTVFEAQSPELDVRVRGDTRAEAIEKLEAEIEAVVQKAANEGERLRPPLDVATEASEITLALAGPIWKDLQYHAQAQNLEPEALAIQILSRGLGHMDGRSRRRPRDRDTFAETGANSENDPQPENTKPDRKEPPKNRRGRGRGRREGYRPDMEDQANFLAYVRDQERGGRGRR